MKNQSTFSDIEYQNRKHTTPKEEFLDAMNAIVPWDRWIKLIEPYYPKGKRGRPTRGIETMLRMYLLQDWFNLSDKGIEDAIYDSYCMRKFMGLDFMTESVPDATTLLKYRHLLEKHDLCKAIFDDVKEALDQERCHQGYDYRKNKKVEVARKLVRDGLKANSHMFSYMLRYNIKNNPVAYNLCIDHINRDKVMVVNQMLVANYSHSEFKRLRHQCKKQDFYPVFRWERTQRCRRKINNMNRIINSWFIYKLARLFNYSIEEY